jgi:outer membrane protein assembly factor BamB
MMMMRTNVLLATAVVCIAGLMGCPGEDGEPSEGEGEGEGEDEQPGDMRWLAMGNGSAGDDQCRTVAAAADNVVIALCDFRGLFTWTSPGSTGELLATGGSDAVLVGLDATTGDLLWTRQIGSVGDEEVVMAPAATLNDGRVAVIVRLGGPASVPGVDLTTVDAGDAVLFIVDATGTVSAARRLCGNINAVLDDMRFSLRPTADGGLVAGLYYGGTLTVLPDSADEATLLGVGDGPGDLSGPFDSVILWLDSDLGLERLLNVGAPGGTIIARAAPAADGGIGITGNLRGSVTFGTATPLTLTAGGDPAWGDGFLVVLDAAGEPRWGFTFGAEGDDMARTLVQTSDGGWLMGGYFNYNDGEGGSDPTLRVPGLTATLTGDGESAGDLFALAVSPDGTPRWLWGATSPDLATAYHVAPLDDGGAVLVGAVIPFPIISAFTPTRVRLLGDDADLELTGTSTVLTRLANDGSVVWRRVADRTFSMGAAVLPDGRVVEASAYVDGGIFAEGEPGEVTLTPIAGWDAAVVLHAP